MQQYFTELKYAIFISALGFIWLMGEYVVGLQDKYIQYHPYISWMAIFIPFILLFIAILHKRDQDLDGIISFGQAFKTGLIITVLCAVIAMPLQVVFHYMINPRYFDVMSEEYIYNSIDKGMSEEDAQNNAAMYFNIKSYVIQVAIETFIIGLLISAFHAWILKRSSKPEDNLTVAMMNETEILEERMPRK